MNNSSDINDNANNSDANNNDANNNDEILYLSSDWKSSAGLKPSVFDFAEDMIIFLILLPLLLLPLRIMGSGTAAYLSTALVPVDFMLLTRNRGKSKKIIYFVLILIPVTVCAALLLLLCRNYFAAAVAVIAAAVSCSKLKKTISQQEKNFDRDARHAVASNMGGKTVYAGAFTCYLAYITAFCLGYKDMTVVAFVDFAVIFAIMLIYRHTSGAACLSQWNKTAENTGNAGYGKNSGKATGAAFSFFAVAAVGVIALLVFIIANLSGISRIDTAVIGWFKSANSQQVSSAPISQSSSAPSEDMSNILSKYASGKTSAFSDILGKAVRVFGYIIVIIALIAVVTAISRAVLGLCRRMGENINEESRSLITVDDAVSKVKEQIRRISRRLDIFAHGGNRMKIRRLFFTHVKRHNKGVIVKSSDSPIEIGGKIAQCEGGDLSAAAEIYEKARYGSDECADSDVKRMKDALK